MAKRYSRKTKDVRRRRRTRGGGPKLNALKKYSKKAARRSMQLGTKGVGYGLKGLSKGVNLTGKAAKKLSEVTPSISNKLQNMGDKTLNKASDMDADIKRRNMMEKYNSMPVAQAVPVAQAYPMGGTRKRTRKNKKGGASCGHLGHSGGKYTYKKRGGTCSAGGAKKSRKRTRRNTRKTDRRVRRR